MPRQERVLPLRQITVRPQNETPQTLDSPHVSRSSGSFPIFYPFLDSCNFIIQRFFFKSLTGEINFSVEYERLIGQQSEKLLGYIEMRQPFVFELGYVGLSIHQGSRSPHVRTAARSFL